MIYYDILRIYYYYEVLDMSRAYNNILPFVIINLGGEMVYILEQRLRSQDISSERSQKVIQDIVKSIFAPKFIEELFRPQPMYSM